MTYRIRVTEPEWAKSFESSLKTWHRGLNGHIPRINIVPLSSPMAHKYELKRSINYIYIFKRCGDWLYLSLEFEWGINLLSKFLGAKSTAVIESSHNKPIIWRTSLASSFAPNFSLGLQIFNILSREAVANRRESWLQAQLHIILECLEFLTLVWW